MGDFKKKANRTEYCHREDVNIVKYLMAKDAWHLTSGNLIWQKMEKAKICPNRSFHSLRNRYLRNIQKRLKIDFKHILNQTQNHKNSKTPKNCDYEPRLENKSIETSKNVELYDNPKFSETPDDVECVSIEEIDGTPHKIIKSIENNLTKGNSSIGKFKGKDPVVVLTPLKINLDDHDTWLSADHQEVTDKQPSKKQLFSDYDQRDINLDDKSCNNEDDDSESMYFSVACVRNKVILESQDNGSDHVLTNVKKDYRSPSKIKIIKNIQDMISNIKSFSKNSNANNLSNSETNNKDCRREKESCVTAKCSRNNICVLKKSNGTNFRNTNKKLDVKVDNCTKSNEKVESIFKNVGAIENCSHTQEIIDLTEKPALVSKEVEKFSIDHDSQPSTPSMDRGNSASQTDLFSPNKLKLLSKDPKKLTPSSSPKSESFFSCITTRSQLKMASQHSSSPSSQSSDYSACPELHYLGLTRNKKIKDKQKTSASLSRIKDNQNITSRISQNSTTSKKVGEVKLLPNSTRRRFLNNNSRLHKYKVLSRRIVELHQMIRSLGVTRSKRHQRQLNSLAQYILNMKGRKNIKRKTSKAQQNAELKVLKTQQVETLTQVQTRKSPRATAGHNSFNKDQSVDKSSTSTAKLKPRGSSLSSGTRDTPKRGSILLENMLSCLEIRKREFVRKSLDERNS